MSNNVLKVSKQQSQPNSSGHLNLNPFSNSILQLQRNISLDFPKEKELTAHSKDSHSQATSSQQNIKKLAVLLDPHKDLNNCVNSSYTSPKSFVGNSTKSTNLKASASSLENSNLNLISPKDLVRLAMSKNKSKALVKKVPVQSSTSLPRNTRKSVCLRSGESRSKKRDRSNSKATCTTLCDEPSILSKTTLPMHQEKNSKLKRMKLIYNDSSQSDLAARLARSSIYTPQEASGRFWQGTLSPNRSNSGLLWPGSPNPNISATSATNAKSKLFANQIGLGISGKENEDSKTEESHRKRGSVGHIGGHLRESQSMKKQTKKSEKKTVQSRQTVSTENLKASSLLYSKLLSQNAAHQEAIERAKSPTVQLLDEIDENQDVLEISEYIKDKETKPREEFIADLKNWVNDIVKPQDEIPEIIPKKAAVAEKVKEVQEGLLAKLRDALDNDEFVRREDYERLYTEKENIEEELDATKEENAQLRVMLWKIQEEKEARENELAEKEKSSSHQDSQDYQSTIQALQELVARQNMELEDLRRRETIVQDVLQMIWKAGSQIGGFPKNNMMRETPQSHHQQKGFETELNSYVGENDNYVSSIKPESYTGQQEMAASEATSRNPLALSEMEDSEFETFNIKPLLTMAKSPHIPMNPIQKVQTNFNQSMPLNPEVSTLPVTYQNYFPTKSQDKLKLDLTGLGGNVSRPKSNNFSTQSSIPNINKPIMTDTAQPMGFHEEFMSKLEEFSLSWRQDALLNQKF